MEKKIKQLTKEEAIKFIESDVWKEWDAEQIVKFQLFQDRICLPFDLYHKSLQEVLKRPVYTHEIGCRDWLINEYLKKKKAPTFEEIINLIPKEKRIVIGI